ncbi:hypothetical protein [Methanolobus sp.]|uniref:hypothetical protein n=1 Tax=Methanolobus sp. TaxID=1874737 RepID=UPI0025D10D73|nr:hypothetical protein [Methanolobus sp.]
MRILRDIFTSSGYEVTESFRYDLVAEKNGLKTIIKLSYSPDLAEISDFASQVTEGQALYVVADDAGEKVRRHAIASGVQVWGRDDVALKIGRAVLADMEGKTAELDLLETVIKKPVSKVDEVAKEAINAIFGTGTSSLVEQRAFEDPVRPLASKPHVPSVERVAEVKYYRPGTAASVQVPEDDGVEFLSNAPEIQEDTPVAASPEPTKSVTSNSIIMSLNSSPVNIPKDHAFSIATPHVRGANAALLKFVPFWKYNYSLNVEHRYKSKIIDISGDGSGCLNALNGHVESMHLDDIQKKIAVPDVEYDVKMPATTEDQARKQLLDMVVEEYTRNLRFDATQGDAIISEHKRFKPSASDIALIIELVYVPIWEIKGQRNSVEINAYSGEVLQNPVDDDVEFI